VARQHQGNDKRPTTKRPRHAWPVAVGVVLAAVIAGLLWAGGVFRNRRSADERLAEIEAARAIPDAENAAIIYNELLQDPNAASLLTYCPQFLEPPIFNQVCNRPWLAKDRPELTAWIQEHRYIIDGLLEASRQEECRFPLSIDIMDTSPVNRAAPMRQWAFLLTMAANNDLAEGRTDSALAKWQCLLRMQDHLRQQPVLLDHLLGNGVARLALEPVAQFIVTGSVPEARWREIEALPWPVQDTWKEDLKTIRTIDDLKSRKLVEPLGPLDRLQHRYVSFRISRAVTSVTGGKPNRSPYDDAGRNHQRNVATARGIRILVALRRFRDTTGRWPASLDEVEASLPGEILTDPFNKGPFMYKPAADTFRLYSRGPNTIDEDGKWDPDAGSDDWPIWPARDRMDEKEKKDANEP
jgi:hypothetical protein